MGEAARNNEFDAREAMNDMYHWTRHVYNLSRKFYLLGRDHLIRNLKAHPGETICEIGCGTARNLIKMAERYPESSFYGFDASDEMLVTARASLKRNGQEKIRLAQGLAQNFNPKKAFDLTEPFDKVVFSYALSIIPPWRESLDHALKLVKPGGEIHIVDFGGQEDLPPAFQKMLFWWLQKFHVYHKPEIAGYLRRLEFEKCGTLKIEHLYKGYSYNAVFKKN